MKFLRVAPVVAVLLVVGCSTGEVDQGAVQSWYGADKEALIDAWGPPTAEEDRADGGQVLEWAEHYRGLPREERAAVIGVGAAIGGVLGGTIAGMAGGPPSDCITRVIITPEGVVDAGLMSGNGCSPPPKRE